MFDDKLNYFVQKLQEKKLDGFIVTNHFNIFYLCGFKGISPTERESILIFNPKPTLITAKLYQAEAQKLASMLKIKIAAERNQIIEFIKTLLKKSKRAGFEEDDLKVAELAEFEKMLPKVKFVACRNFVEDLRIIKSDEEIKRIEKAQIISQKAFGKLVKTIKIGQTEEEIAERLAKIIKSLGGEGLAFENIVAAGPNSALPHYFTGREKVKKGEVLLLDFGAKFQNYCADMTRTIFIGKPKTEQANIYHHVEKAQREAIRSITAGITAHDAYFSAHTVFKNRNLHDYFLHSLGHGIGLEVHERPHIRPTPSPAADIESADEILAEGMVFSVEPGLYFPAWGGIRIEDLVVIKNGKARVLGKLQENITVIER